MSDPSFYIDKFGIARGRCSREMQLLGDFLESDVQGASSARRLVNALDEIRSGVREHFENIGNAYTVTLSPSSATLEFDPSDGVDVLELVG